MPNQTLHYMPKRIAKYFNKRRRFLNALWLVMAAILRTHFLHLIIFFKKQRCGESLSEKKRTAIAVQLSSISLYSTNYTCSWQTAQKRCQPGSWWQRFRAVFQALSALKPAKKLLFGKYRPKVMLLIGKKIIFPPPRRSVTSAKTLIPELFLKGNITIVYQSGGSTNNFIIFQYSLGDFSLHNDN